IGVLCHSENDKAEQYRPPVNTPVRTTAPSQNCSEHLITPLDDNYSRKTLTAKITFPPPHNLSKNCHLEEQLPISCCTPIVPEETMVSLSTFSPQTATIISLKNLLGL
ncbi:hypothetical protein GOODEAATRI_032099, partial [Goodea atripinnis]